MDNKWWDNYYLSNKSPLVPSSFAVYILNKLPSNTKRIIELGSGNGRDSLFFFNNGLSVIGLDASSEIIENNKKKYNNSHLNFFVHDFTKRPEFITDPVDVIYSRFSFHSINHEKSLNTLKWSYDILQDGGIMCIETRSTNDPLCSQGTIVSVGENSYNTTHYRRFTTIDLLKKDIINTGFVILEIYEDFSSSWYKDDHAVVIRVIAKKIIKK